VTTTKDHSKGITNKTHKLTLHLSKNSLFFVTSNTKEAKKIHLRYKNEQVNLKYRTKVKNGVI
jgi:hypothetical protein